MRRDLTDRLRANRLFDLYGGLLTEYQQRLLRLYYFHDLSLAEIAEQFGVSRQAIFDTLRRSTEELERIEGSLRMMESRQQLAQRLDTLDAALRRLAERFGRHVVVEIAAELEAVRRLVR